MLVLVENFYHSFIIVYYSWFYHSIYSIYCFCCMSTWFFCHGGWGEKWVKNGINVLICLNTHDKSYGERCFWHILLEFGSCEILSSSRRCWGHFSLKLLSWDLEEHVWVSSTFYESILILFYVFMIVTTVYKWKRLLLLLLLLRLLDVLTL